MRRLSDIEKVRILSDLAKSFGGQLVKVRAAAVDRTPLPYSKMKPVGIAAESYSAAPFAHPGRVLGQDWGKKIIYYSSALAWREIVHEMGHAFATTQNTSLSEEWSWFGWEIAVAKLVDPQLIQWRRPNSYVVDRGEYPEVQDLPDHELWAMAEERLAAAVADGIITPDFKPLSVR